MVNGRCNIDIATYKISPVHIRIGALQNTIAPLKLHILNKGAGQTFCSRYSQSQQALFIRFHPGVVRQHLQLGGKHTGVRSAVCTVPVVGYAASPLEGIRCRIFTADTERNHALGAQINQTNASRAGD